MVKILSTMKKQLKTNLLKWRKKLEGSIFTFWLFTLKPSSCINRNKDSLMGSPARQLILQVETCCMRVLDQNDEYYLSIFWMRHLVPS